VRLRKPQRKGTTVVECAVVYSITFFLILALIVGGMGIFRYQEMAALSREAARYAGVHGTKYAKDAAVATPTPSDIYNNVILPRAVSLNQSNLSYSITYNTSNDPYHVKIVNGDVIPVYNTVSVTLTYQWVPEVYLGGITLSSTSCMPMSY
jgi:Flp pilus assembly protein TadG